MVRMPEVYCAGIGDGGQRCLVPMHVCGGEMPVTGPYLRAEVAHVSGCDEGESVHGRVHRAGLWEHVELARGGVLHAQEWWELSCALSGQSGIYQTKIDVDGHEVSWSKVSEFPASSWQAWARYRTKVARGGGALAEDLPSWLSTIVAENVRVPELALPIPALGIVSGTRCDWTRLEDEHDDLLVVWAGNSDVAASRRCAWELSRSVGFETDLTLTLTLGGQGQVVAQVDAMAVSCPSGWYGPEGDSLRRIDALLSPVEVACGSNAWGNWPFDHVYEWGWLWSWS